MAAELLAFLTVSVLVIVTPGPDTALTVRNSAIGGRRAGVLTAAGVAAGQACWTVAASAGVAALLVASEPAFVALKLAGAAYLVFLGLQSLHAALRRGERLQPGAATAGGRSLAPRVALRQGLVSNLANPKMAVFFSSLLPQFAGAGPSPFVTLLVLGLVFCALTFAWLSCYAAAVAKAGDLLRRSRVRRTLDAVMGTVLVGLGVRLATEQR